MMNNVHNPNLVSFGLMGAHMSSNPNDQAQQLSRSSSNSEERGNVPAPVQQQYNSVPTSMAQQMNPQLANYSMSQNQNGVPMFNAGSNGNQQQSGLDWQAMFSSQQQQGGALQTQATYANSTFHPNDTFTQTARHNSESPRQAGPPPSHTTDTRFLFSTWGPPTDRMTYRQLSDKILNFLYPPDVDHQTANLDYYFSPDNVQHFLENFSHFQAHFSILHIPTFDVPNAYPGLLTVMCCIGACYSDRVSAAHVRELVPFVKAALERDPRMLTLLREDRPNGNGLQEIQSLTFLHVLLTWNGNPASRHSARQVYAHIVALARKHNLLRVPHGADPLHQPNFNIAAYNPSTFNWRLYTEQEERIRVMHFIGSMDVAIGLYFNIPPAFDYRELDIPLPCDDAVFEATDSRSCAEALGLYGPELARTRNPNGTLRPSQPWLAPAVDALLHSSYQIQPGATNLTGKFLIIHTILALVRRVQVEGSVVIKFSPMPQHEWLVNVNQDGKSGPPSANNSGRNTPVNGSIPPQTLKALFTALDKWKQNWDYDYVTQFPPSVYLPGRYGFSKDAIHFWWLTKHLLKKTSLSDLELPAEERFAQVMNLLKSAKQWVETDGASRGEEMGSVGEIDRDYGSTGLTLDMAKIFRPLPRVVESTTPINLSAKGIEVKTEAA